MKVQTLESPVYQPVTGGHLWLFFKVQESLLRELSIRLRLVSKVLRVSIDEIGIVAKTGEAAILKGTAAEEKYRDQLKSDRYFSHHPDYLLFKHSYLRWHPELTPEWSTANFRLLANQAQSHENIPNQIFHNVDANCRVLWQILPTGQCFVSLCGVTIDNEEKLANEAEMASYANYLETVAKFSSY